MLFEIIRLYNLTIFCDEIIFYFIKEKKKILQIMISLWKKKQLKWQFNLGSEFLHKRNLVCFILCHLLSTLNKNAIVINKSLNKII